MALTPVEIRHVRLRRSLFGYQAGQTDELLAEVVASFEDVWRDRADLADKIEQLEGELARYRELEQLLRTTLVSAERASQQTADQARRDYEATLNEARVEAREIVREAMIERERLNAEIVRIRAQLEALLTTMENQSRQNDRLEAESAGERAWAESSELSEPPIPSLRISPPLPRDRATPPESQETVRIVEATSATNNGLRLPDGG